MILKPSNIVYNIEDHFPKLTWGKAGVALSGGLESTLIAKIAIDYYGADNVVLLFSDNMFTLSNTEANVNVHINVNNAAALLGQEVHYFDVDTNLHFTDMDESVKQIGAGLASKHNVEFTMWGFTKLFFDVAEFKEDPNATHEYIIKTCYTDPVKYKSIIEEFHLPTGTHAEYVKDLDIPGIVYKMLKSPNGRANIKRPFDTLNKSEVVDLYIQLGCLDLAYKTHSCISDDVRENHTHCGTCFNCQQRYDAFAKLGIEDLTTYKSNKIKDQWNTLVEKLNAN